jgi:phage regulator Rha-like protein
MVKNMPFNFSNDYIKAFKELKHRLISAPLLRYYWPELKSILEINTSDGVVIGILS